MPRSRPFERLGHRSCWPDPEQAGSKPQSGQQPDRCQMRARDRESRRKASQSKGAGSAHALTPAAVVPLLLRLFDLLLWTICGVSSGLSRSYQSLTSHPSRFSPVHQVHLPPARLQAWPGDSCLSSPVYAPPMTNIMGKSGGIALLIILTCGYTPS